LKPPGQFITFEGLDGCGKSTQVELVGDYLRRQGRTVIITREPGGTEVGQQIREILLNVSEVNITPLTELCLMFAARAQHVEQAILPALKRGELVLCDRFTDSSLAYQGYGRGVPLDTILSVERLLCQGLRPDLTLLLDIDAATSIRRTGVRNRKAHQLETRFEMEGQRFFERVREGYLALARQEPNRVRIIDGSGTIEQLQAAVRAAVDEFLETWQQQGGRVAGGAGGI
jgi:dTMP kinase